MCARHDLVWLSARGWQSVRSSLPDGYADAVDRWRRHDWPATVRRMDADAAKEQICLGITLPFSYSAGAKTRIPFRCGRSEIARIAGPLAMHEAWAAVPDRWKSGFSALQSDACGKRLNIRVYGSLALQALTGQSYLSAGSDIDLLFFPATADDLREGGRLFEDYLRVLPLDGEVVFPGGQAVAWKEWCGAWPGGAQSRVLVKDLRKVSLSDTDALLSTLEEHSCQN